MSPQPLPYAQLPIRLLAMMVLDDVGVPLRGRDLRDAIERRYKRAVTPHTFTSIATTERRTFGNNARTIYLAPALRVDGVALRGWWTSSAWPFYNRILPDDAIPIACSRAIERLHSRPAPDFTKATEKQIAEARHVFRGRDLFYQVFGIQASKPTTMTRFSLPDNKSEGTR